MFGAKSREHSNESAKDILFLNTISRAKKLLLFTAFFVNGLASAQVNNIGHPEELQDIIEAPAIHFENPELLNLGSESEQIKTLKIAEELEALVWAQLEADRDSMGQDELLKNVDKVKYKITIRDKGEAELRVSPYQKKIYARVKLEHLEYSFVFLENDQFKKEELDPRFLEMVSKDLSPEEMKRVKADQKEFNKILAAQHISAGDKGRDAVVVFKSINAETNQLQLDAQAHLKAEKWSREWWKSYGTYVLQKPEKQHYIFGTFCAVAQGGLMLCMAKTNQMINGGAIDIGPILINMGTGFTLGVNAGTYTRWTHLGSKPMQRIKNSMISFFTAYLTVGVAEGFHKLYQIYDPSAAFLHGRIFLNAIANNWAKVEWNQIVKMRSQLRLNEKPWEPIIKIPFTRYAWKPFRHQDGPDKGRGNLNQYEVENQGMYLIPFSFKIPDLLGYGVKLENWEFPLGKLLLWSSIPLAQYLKVRYAERLGVSQAPVYRAQWEETKGYLNPLTTISTINAHRAVRSYDEISGNGTESEKVLALFAHLGYSTTEIESFIRNELSSSSAQELNLGGKIVLRIHKTAGYRNTATFATEILKAARKPKVGGHREATLLALLLLKNNPGFEAFSASLIETQQAVFRSFVTWIGSAEMRPHFLEYFKIIGSNLDADIAERLGNLGLHHKDAGVRKVTTEILKASGYENAEFLKARSVRSFLCELGLSVW